MRQTVAALRMLLVLTALTGVIYPLTIWCVGRVAFPDRAGGSLVSADGRVVGSSLIGQDFPGDAWFHSRPSAGDYDALASGASNLGPENADLIRAIDARRSRVAGREGIDAADVPADAVTASGSGLDPYISPVYARQQIDRVAAARGLDAEQVGALVDAHTEGRTFGFLGQPRVDVLGLNVDLMALADD